MHKCLILALLLTAAAHAAPVMVVRGTQYLDGWQLDANGWLDTSVLTADDVFYVSSSIGNDSYDGTSGTVDGGDVGPKETLAAASALVSTGDWLLLKRGDDFSSEHIGSKLFQGTSKTAPALIGAYGTGARPILQYISIANNSIYVVVMDVHCVNDIKTYASDSFYENIHTGGTETLTTSAVSNIYGQRCVLNRCIFDDHYYNGDAQRGGFYLGSATPSYTYLINECVMDQDGDREPRYDENWGGNPHHTYIGAHVVDVTMQKCVVTRGPGEGIMCRGTDADVSDNLIYDNAGGGLVLGGYLMIDNNPSGITYSATNNILVNNGIGTPRHTASTPASVISGNVIYNSHLGVGGVSDSSDSGELVGVLGLTVSGNIVYGGRINVADTNYSNTAISSNIIYNTAGRVIIFYSAGWLSGDVTWSNNGLYTPVDPTDPVQLNSTGYSYAQFIANTSATGTVTTEPTFVDVARDMESYMEEVYGQGDVYASEAEAWDGFIALALAQDRTSWDSRLSAETVNAYLRAGMEASE